MAAIAESVMPRSRQARIFAQRLAYVYPLGGGLYQALDGDEHPIKILNRYLRKLHRKGLSTAYIKNIAYNTVAWIRNAGEADFDWIWPPEIAFETYWNLRRDDGLTLPAARVELSRVHGVFKYAREEGYIDQFPYPTKFVAPGEATHWQGYLVPDILPPGDKAQIAFLPPPSLFRAFYATLPEDAKMPVETMLKTGVRISELLRLADAWARRVRGPAGAAVTLIVGKGGKERYVYAPSDLADSLDALAASNGLFMRANGRPWTERTLSEALTDTARLVGATDSLRISAHILRHAYASWAYQRMKRLFLDSKLDAEPLLVLQELLGHASYETTWNTYVNLFRFDGEDNAENFSIGPIAALLEVMETSGFSNARRIGD